MTIRHRARNTARTLATMALLALCSLLVVLGDGYDEEPPR